ncbi:MAG: ATP-binding protein [Burkholderiales bacterium]|nr:ATP-binding protein [Burkholderiales bacterium]
MEYKPNRIIWLNNEQSKIKNTISNLLNNAFEAGKNNSNNIKLMVDLENNKIIIYVQDFGCGINEKDLNDILNGKSLKINGNGIGLSTAQKFMISINGTLSLDSNDSEINHGTIIKLALPSLSFSEQFATKINISTKNIIIVDDDSNIINFWQEYFLFNAKTRNVMYFMNFSSLKEHLSQEPNTNEITYLLDYNILGEKITGIDIIKDFGLKNVYLITNYAEDVKLQDEIKSLPLKLVPKTMLPIMLRNQAIY